MTENKIIVEEPVAYVVEIDDGANDTVVEVVEEQIAVIDVATQGPAGAQGPLGPQGSQGPQGEQGPPGEDVFYTHNQLSAESVWNITHNLGKVPSVTVVDSGGTEVVGEIEHHNVNSLTITFSAPFTGKAYLN